MLHDLTFLDAGKPFPPESEKPRLKRYEEGRLLFEGRHDKVYGNWWRTLRQDLRASLEIVYNFPRRLSNLWADLLIGEPPTYKAPRGQDPNAVEDLVREMRLNDVIREVAIDMSRFGDGLFKVRLKDGKPVPEAVSPELWFPVVRRGDVRDITHHVIAWTFEREKERLAGYVPSARERYLVYEIHTREAVEHHLKRLGDDGKIGAEVDATEFFEDWPEGGAETHAAAAPLIVHVPNQRTSNRLFGYDDYTDIDGILQDYEVALSQLSRVRDRHGDPAMAGPRLSPPEAGTEDASRVAAGERYFEIEDPEGVRPEYITQQINVEVFKATFDRYETLLYTASETSPAAFGQIRAGASESGTSLKLQMKSERSKAARLRTELDPAVKQVIRLATALAGKETDVEIAWKDGLPDDEKEQTQIEAQKRQAGLTSLLSAIQRLEDLDEKAAKEEIGRIREELFATPLGGGSEATNGSLTRSRALFEGLAGGAED